MGEIFIEGLGTVEIQGDEPTQQELNAILQNIGDPEDQGDESVTLGGPTELEQVDPEGTLASAQIDRPGPLGIVPPSFRRKVREGIEEEPGLMQFLMEIGPSAAAGFAGATAGAAAGGPLGGFVGGVAGSLGGEAAAQELGIAPASNLNLALAGGGAAAGPLLGKTFQGIRRVAGQGFIRAPFVRTARARNLMGRAVDEFESLGASILSKQQGVAGKTASELYAAARRGGVKVSADALKNSRQAMLRAFNNLRSARGLGQEVREARVLLKDTAELLLQNPEGLSIDSIVRARQRAGKAIKKLAGSGEAEGIAKSVFGALDDDLAKIAQSPFKKGRQARLAQAAIKRAKLQFSVETFEQNIANAMKVQGDDVIINFKNIQNWLNKVTNPKNKAFDKNFSESLKGEIPALKKRLAELVKLTAVGGPGGPGSLVLRGQAAKLGRGLVGGALGFLGTGGSAAGAAIGGVAFAQMPEIMVSILTTKPGAAFLEKAAKFGQGSINRRAWMLAGELAFRSLGEQKEPVGLTAEEARERLAAQQEAEEEPGLTSEEEEALLRQSEQTQRRSGRARPRLPEDISERIPATP